ncbi:tRNA (adenosine(37)-N6)-threonylcarbamoyltransferase complex dimerization subunit type 1 TsaB [Caldalkalibacillus salinus]|uniref:tRNA (adenosine(37)-N6)-threonylcarbamoyltransferase complex dimerization subunit type 1 TsaB n=1 Tax=Caldalkalibacillus salinus TaxID=2803787 RepID=UPI0019229C45|nr:tRNA (adenosine(37)-N6)-threonylcarbamoyltransferase complex dimerization subunit type 1 TsaB [Caldalkalibacillus salinus]
MKLLAIDTSNWPLGLAVLQDGAIVGETNTHLPKNHSLRLMPAVEALLNDLDTKPQALDKIVVAQGPGSYTGVRIGVTTAKVLAWTLQLPIIGISSLQVVAQNCTGHDGLIVPLFDARRGNVYAGVYETNQDKTHVTTVMNDEHVHLETFLHELRDAYNRTLLFVGQGAIQHRELITTVLGEQAYVAREVDHTPRGSQLAYLGFKQQGRELIGEDIHAFAPTYLQLSEAEAKWKEKQERDRLSGNEGQ